MMVMKDVTATNGGEAQKLGGDQGTGKAEDWGAQGDDGGIRLLGGLSPR